MYSPNDIFRALSPAQLSRLHKAEPGKQPAMDLIALDPPLLKPCGSRTKIGEQVNAIHTVPRTYTIRAPGCSSWVEGILAAGVERAIADADRIGLRGLCVVCDQTGVSVPAGTFTLAGI